MCPDSNNERKITLINRLIQNLLSRGKFLKYWKNDENARLSKITSFLLNYA